MKRVTLFILTAFFSLILFSACGNKQEQEDGTVKIGFVKSPFLTSLYDAERKNDENLNIELIPFGNDEDSGYALLAAKADAAFIEPERALKLVEGNKKDLKIAGVVQFPYGATLIVRKDHSIRLNEIEGLTVAAEDEDCILFQHFINDLEKYGIDAEKINFVFIPFSSMIPALESKSVDAAISKASYAVVAEAFGHKTLYQSWSLPEGGDDCCPQYLANAEYFLVVRAALEKSVGELLTRLVDSSDPQNLSENSHAYLAAQLGYPESYLAEFTPAVFTRISEDLAADIGKEICITEP